MRSGIGFKDRLNAIKVKGTISTALIIDHLLQPRQSHGLNLNWPIIGALNKCAPIRSFLFWAQRILF